MRRIDIKLFGIIIIALRLGCRTWGGHPIICTERADGEAIVHQVANSPILKGITNGDGMPDFVADDIDAITTDPNFRGRTEHTVGARYLEIIRR